MALANRCTAIGSQSLCPRCFQIFLNTKACQSLTETGNPSPYRIDHYKTSELKKYADKGCTLCSILSRELRRDEDENMDSFFKICSPPTTGPTSEIEWLVVRNNRPGWPDKIL